MKRFRAVYIIWLRDLKRHFRDRARIVGSLGSPIIFIFILGQGLGSTIGQNLPVGGGNLDYKTFMFPGILGMTVLFAGVFASVSIVWDREFGFMREMLVAPVRRGALVLGKCLGGATVATIQGTVMLLLAGLVHVPYSPALLFVLVLEMALAAFMITAIGILLASRMAQVESFQAVIQFFVMPMFFLSGALFPLTGLPPWLLSLAKIDPLSYAVDPMRRAVFAHLAAPVAITRLLDAGITWDGWRLPTFVELALVATVGASMLTLAVIRFSKTE